MPDGVGEVDDPGAGRAEAPHVVGDVEHDGDGPQRLGEAARPRRLLADAAEPQRDRLVAQARRLAADAELEEHERGAVEGLRRGRRWRRAGRPKPRVVEDPPGEPADDRQALGVGVEQDQLVDRQPVAAQAEALDELGRVGAAAADDGDLHPHGLPPSYGSIART